MVNKKSLVSKESGNRLKSLETSERRPEKAALYAVIVNSCSTLIKFLMASMTGSLAVMAEALHSFSDIITSSLVFDHIKDLQKLFKECNRVLKKRRIQDIFHNKSRILSRKKSCWET